MSLCPCVLQTYRHTDIRTFLLRPSASARGRGGLADLPLDHLSLVTNPLPLVGLRLFQLSDIGRHLPHEILVESRHREFDLFIDADLDPLRDRKKNRV